MSLGGKFLKGFASLQRTGSKGVGHELWGMKSKLSSTVQGASRTAMPHASGKWQAPVGHWQHPNGHLYYAGGSKHVPIGARQPQASHWGSHQPVSVQHQQYVSQYQHYTGGHTRHYQQYTHSAHLHRQPFVGAPYSHGQTFPGGYHSWSTQHYTGGYHYHQPVQTYATRGYHSPQKIQPYHHRQQPVQPHYGSGYPRKQTVQPDSGARIPANHYVANRQGALKTSQPGKTELLHPEVRAARRADGRRTITAHANSDVTLRVNNRYLPSGETRLLKSGEIVQVDNKLYKVTHKNELFLVSKDAELVSDLFPNGIHDIAFKQQGMGDCAKLALVKSMLDDPSGQATRAFLSRFSRGAGSSYEIKFANGRVHKFRENNFEWDSNGRLLGIKAKPGECRAVEGDPGIKMLERAHYAQRWKELPLEQRKQFLARHSFTGEAPAHSLQRVNTLSREMSRLDKQWSDDFGQALLGKNWKKTSFDGSQGHTNLEIKRNWVRKKQTFSEHIKHDPHAYQRMQAKFNEIERNPSTYRYSAVTRWTKGNDGYRLPLSDGSTLFGNHAYSLKEIVRDSMGQRIFKIINPHDTSKVMSIGEHDFLRNFSVLNGIQYKPTSL